MKLRQLTKRVWYYPMEEERDRPNLGYIRGDRWSLAVDAGHSDAHTEEFYDALREAGLPLPQLTVLTHWHWDHTFGLHAVNGLSLANRLTNQYLRDFRDRIEKSGPEGFLSMDECIRREYANNRQVRVVPADLEFSGEMLLDAGNCRIRVFQTTSPHTDDSTLVEAVDEKVLFLGDAACGEFPTWEKDPEKTRILAESIASMDVRYCLEGHWAPQTKEQTIADLLKDILPS